MASARFRSSRAAVFALLLVCGSALADPPSAASLFDEGVRRFNQSDYERAAEAFLRADELAPNAQALTNAIAAGRRGHAYLLVARAAERVLSRSGADAELSRLAREALVEAAAHLARIELSCAPPRAGDACKVSIDGAPALPGTRYVLPGTHRFGAEANGARDEKALTCEAAATCTVALRPASGAGASSSASSSASASAAPSSTAAPSSSGWPPAVVYAGAGITAVLLGVTVWSGADAIGAKNALLEQPSTSGRDDVLGRAHRTDALLAGTAVAAAATVVAAVWLVSWKKPSSPAASVGVAASPAGATAVVRGRF